LKPSLRSAKVLDVAPNQDTGTYYLCVGREAEHLVWLLLVFLLMNMAFAQWFKGGDVALV
jgi:hypothetical protein